MRDMELTIRNENIYVVGDEERGDEVRGVISARVIFYLVLRTGANDYPTSTNSNTALKLTTLLMSIKWATDTFGN